MLRPILGPSPRPIRGLPALLVWPVALLLAAGLLTTPAQASDPEAAPEPVVPAISWGACGKAELRSLGLQCGSLEVPLDHADPTGPTIRLALSRMQHTTAVAKGVLLVNPGGPGGSGLSLASVGEYVPRGAGAAYDWIGFDPRGVGASSPALRCNRHHFGVNRPSYVPRRTAIARYWLRKSRAYAAACADTAAKRALLPHLTTLDTVRDMELIRQALAAEKLNYYGFSYGTYLGQVYASRYPDRVGRFVLDGVVDPTRTWYASNLDQDRAFDRNLGTFWAYLARYPGTFHLGRSKKKIRRGYYRLLRRLDRKPAANRRLGPAELADALLEAGYYVFDWDLIGRDYSQLVRRNRGAAMFNRYRATQMGDDNGYAVYNAVQCTDAPWPSWAVTRRQSWAVHRTAPFLTWGNTWFNAPCLSWRAPSHRRLAVSGAAVTAKILLISETRDAATPYSGALRTRALFRSASLVAGVGGTTHSGSLSGVACVDNAVAAYLASGTVPTRLGGTRADRRCGRIPPPNPTWGILSRDAGPQVVDRMSPQVRRTLLEAQRLGR